MKPEEKFRKRLNTELERRRLASVMNKTKWVEFEKAMEEELPFPPPYARKDVLEEEYHALTEDVSYWGDYKEGLYPYISIEWIEVRPRYFKYHDQLVSIEKEFLEVLKKYNIPYKATNGSYIIYGYASDFSEIAT